ncbi:MAG: ABC transporter substrate-binding protein [Sulfolobales archaeon]
MSSSSRGIEVLSIMIVVMILGSIFLSIWPPIYMINVYAQESTAILKLCIPSPGKVLDLNPYFYIASPPLTHCMILKLVYETLAEEKSDGSLEPLLATQWSTSQDGKTITIKLRSNVYWHDGTPFTSRDVAFVLTTIKRYPGGDVYSIGRYIESLETPDNLTIIIKLTQPFSRFLYYLLTGYRIFPQHIFSDKNMAEFPARDPRYAIGTGPYRLVEANFDTQIFRFAAFERYWGGSPKVSEIVVQVVDESAPIPVMMKTGQCSIASITNPALVPPIVSDPSLGVAVSRGWPYQGSYYTPAGLLVINTAVYPLNITEFRRALAYAINKDRIVQLALQGYGEVASSGQLPMSSKWRPPDLEEISYNASKAREILRSIGFVEGPDHMFRYPNGTPVSIKIIHTGGIASNVVALIIQDWRNAGIEASEEVLTRLTYVNNLAYGYYQVAMLLTNRPTDVDFVLTVFMDRNTTPTPIGQPTQYWGWTRYVNPQFNAYIERARSSLTDGEAFKYYAEAQRIAARDQWVIPLYYSKAIWAFNKRDFVSWEKLQEGEGYPTHVTMLSIAPYAPQTQPAATTIIYREQQTYTTVREYVTYTQQYTQAAEASSPIGVVAIAILIAAVAAISVYIVLRRR